MKNPDEAAGEAEQPAEGGPRRKKKPTKKPAAKKAAARKPAAKKRGKKEEPEAVEAAEHAVPEPMDDAEDVVDAEILAETRIDVGEAGTEAAPQVDVVEESAASMSEEERELSAVYGEDLNAPAIAHTEFSDRQTRDEDRPMMPEINARDERRSQWQGRRDRPKHEREQRRQRRDGGGPP